MALSAGFTYSCSNAAVGGISTLYLANQSDITVTLGTSGDLGYISNLAKVASVGFFAITFEDDGCTFTETIEVTNNKVLYKPEYKIKIGNRKAATKLWMDALQGCDRYIAAHIERAAPTLTWVSGYTATQGLRLISGTSQTGGTMAEDNMIELTIGHPTGVQYPCAPLKSGVSVPT